MINPFNKINYLFLFQVVAHLSVIPMIAYGNITHYMLAILVFFFTGSIGMSGTYHRLLSHKSYVCPKWWEYFGTLMGTIGGTGSSIAWCAVHREHHRFTDTPKDPHSPSHLPWWHIQFFSMFHRPVPKYAADLLRSNFHLNMHKYYWTIHSVYGLLCYLIDPFAVVYLWLFPSFILWHAGSFINTLSHTLGWQDHNTGDTSTNHWLTGICMWGEGWHNNHHNSPQNYRFGEKWYQLDVTARVIELLGFKPRQFENSKNE
jgi:stearoyl-CoA desaturase (delta-9 desaturase)